jgi:O-antigen/teichoic acid export membrane protein
MGVDALSVPIVTERPAARADRPADLGPLTRRASLNAIAGLLAYGVKIGVTLAVTPILVSGLGRSLFGVWEMLMRLGGYVTAADGRPTEALRLLVAQRQADGDHAANRRNVGAALAVWALLLPLVLCVGAVLVWVAPKLTNVPSDLTTPVRIATALLALNFMLVSLGSVPESVLRGMNLGYTRMGLQAVLYLIGGGLAAGAVLAGLGLTGLASAQVIQASATALCFLLLVRTYVKWFGADRPRWPEIKSLFGMSVWLSAGNVVAMVLLASDVVILGAVVGPALVTSYVLTGYAARTAVGLHIFAADAAIPGVGGLLGTCQLDRATRVREELLTLTWLFVTAVGATILVWNRPFLSLWVGAEHYAGVWVNLLIVLLAVQTSFIRVDAYIIDAALRPRQRVVVGAVAAAVTIALTIPLTWAFGIIGMCAGLLVGRAIQSVAYPLLARASLGRYPRPLVTPLRAMRLTVVTALLFGVAVVAGETIATPRPLVWIAGAPLTLVSSAGIALLAGPTADVRTMLSRRLRMLLRGGRPR